MCFINKTMKGKYFVCLGAVWLALLFSCSGREVQKKLKPIHTMIKSRNGKGASSAVVELLKDSTLVQNPKVYNLGKEAKIAENNVENEKIYLKQPYDTVSFFNSTFGIFDYALKCDSIEEKLWKEEGRRFKFRSGNTSDLQRYYPNLCAAGRFFYTKRQYAEVLRFMRLVLDVPHMPVWGNDTSVLESRRYVTNAYLYLRSAFFNKDYVNVSRYKDIVITDTAYRCKTIEMLTLSSGALKDSVSYLDYLRLGLREYPLNPFFFTRLSDYYTSKKDYRGALLLADSMLTVDKDNILFLVSKSVALLNLQRNVESIEISKKVLQLDSTVVPVNYYIGAAYCNLANELVLPTNINSAAYKVVAHKQKEYYRQARPYIERYRTAVPDAKDRWAPLLYRIYLALNLGKEFEEIDTLLQNM